MERAKYSTIAALAELITTHPIDYYKTLKQNKISNIKKYILRNPYKGLTSRLIGILPMRITFWSTLDYLKSNKYSTYYIPLIVSTAQTILDVPIEQSKINQMNNMKMLYIPKNFWKGVLFHYQRNILFAYGFYSGGLLFKDNPYAAGLVGGLIGSLISHPFDCLKTYYQSSGNNLVNLKGDFFIRGIIPRTLQSTISMSIGYGTFILLKNA